MCTGKYVAESKPVEWDKVHEALELYKHERRKNKYDLYKSNLILKQYLRNNQPALHAVLHRVKWRISHW